MLVEPPRFVPDSELARAVSILEREPASASVMNRSGGGGGSIRLDEIRWGGALRGSIPPLDLPTLVARSLWST